MTKNDTAIEPGQKQYLPNFQQVVQIEIVIIPIFLSSLVTFGL